MAITESRFTKLFYRIFRLVIINVLILILILSFVEIFFILKGDKSYSKMNDLAQIIEADTLYQYEDFILSNEGIMSFSNESAIKIESMVLDTHLNFCQLFNKDLDITTKLVTFSYNNTLKKCKNINEESNNLTIGKGNSSTASLMKIVESSKPSLS